MLAAPFPFIGRIIAYPAGKSKRPMQGPGRYLLKEEFTNGPPDRSGHGQRRRDRCYNTCFLLDLPQGYLLCDAGGGNGILSQLEKAGVDLAQIHHLILTHAHSDHLLGAVWVVRMVAAAMNAGRYEGELTIWCDPSVREGLCQMARITLQKKMTDRLGDRILFP